MLCRTENSTSHTVVTWMGRDPSGDEVQKGEDTCTCVADSLHCAAELTQHCKATILQQKEL